jgi:hypothetical protein
VHGLKGLQELLSCSKFTAQKIKNSGKIPFIQISNGKKLMFDREAVIDALTKNVQEGCQNVNN